jgi:hypothetical protein
VKLCFQLRRVLFLSALLLALTSFAFPKDHEGTKIDAGSFGVFDKGTRIGTETFSIYQVGNGSVIESQFKTENTPKEAVQTSVLQLAANGEVRRYEWKELSPGTAEAVVVPNDDFLMQKWRNSAGEKEHEQPYLLPLATSILDDYFFIHREVLAWKFLAIACSRPEKGGGVQCPLKQHTQFAILIPHQQASASLNAEYLGREKVAWKNGTMELVKLEFKTDTSTWQIWLNDQDQFKVMRMAVVGENTTVDRD